MDAEEAVIFVLINSGGQTAFDNFLMDWAPGLNEHLRLITYKEAIKNPEVGDGTYIFTGLTEFTPAKMEAVTGYRNRLAECGKSIRILNDPTTALTRFPLLRELHDRGYNDFNVYRSTDVTEIDRFPVFVRNERGHNGSLTPLLHNSDELQRAIEDIGGERDDLLVVEFSDTSDETGLFRKFGAFLLDGRVIPCDLGISGHFVTKSNDPPTRRQQHELREFVKRGPDTRVRDVFELAGIDYGRMDYSFRGEQMVVWEINTNPGLAWPPHKYDADDLPLQREILGSLRDAFKELDSAPIGWSG
ncbi:MAG TPA: hypothetical protein VE174_07260 [Actinomycetota bacterium]|nr:hypothetical protein [Actinomycetota bacterium]